MKIEQLTIRNYKVYKDVEIRNLSNMCVFLGANGSGKSTLFDVFGFLSDALRENIRTAIAKRGGIAELRSRDSIGPIEFIIKFRNTETGGEKQPLVTYELSSSFFSNNPATTEGSSARINPNAKRRASAEDGSPINAFQKTWK